MGWIQELGDEMGKSKVVKYLVITALIVFMILIGTLSFRVIRDTWRGNDAMKAGPVELPQNLKEEDSIKPALNSGILPPSKASDTLEVKQPPFSQVKPKTELNTLAKEKVNKQQPFVKQENAEGDNNQNSGNNNGNIGGSGNTSHTVNGTNNGINGDVNINKEVELTEEDKTQVLRRIKAIQQNNNIKNNYIMFSLCNGSNAGNFANQLKQFLISNGYEMVGDSDGLVLGYIKGLVIQKDIMFDNKTECVQVIVGVF